MSDKIEEPTPKNIFPLEGDDRGDDHDADTAPPSEDSSAQESSSKRTQWVRIELREWTAARETIARLEARLEAAQQDVRRAVDYAGDLEAECDRLAHLLERKKDERATIRTDRDEERAQRQSLEEEVVQLREQMEALSGLRGRYHLERGRREQLQEQAQVQGDQCRQLQGEVDRLNAALQRAKDAGFRAAIGPLSIELKR